MTKAVYRPPFLGAEQGVKSATRLPPLWAERGTWGLRIPAVKFTFQGVSKSAGAYPLSGQIGVLEIGEEASASIGRACIKRSRPHKIQLSAQPVKIANFVSRLQAVVVGEGVIVKLQNVVVVRESGAEWLPLKCRTLGRADRASIEIAPVDQPLAQRFRRRPD